MALLTATRAAFAQTESWIGGNSGDWNSASHWSPSGVPGAGDNANVTSAAGANQTITYDYTGPAITLGTLTLNLTGGTSNTSETINMSSNSLSASEEDIGGYSLSNGSGTFNQSGGNNTIVNSFILALFGGKGTYNLSAGSLTDSMSVEWIGYGGTGVFNQTGGTNTVTSASGGLVVGEGGNGTYTLSAGSLTASEELLSNEGGCTGTFYQTGGNNTILAGAYSELDLGEAAISSVGNYNISGGNTTINSNVFIGGGGAIFVAGPTAEGSGNLTISNTGQMIVTGTIWLFPGTQNALNLTGGSLSVGVLNLNNSYSQFFWTGGTLTLTGASGENITIDSTSASNFGDSAGTANSFVLGTGQTLNVYGQENVGYNGSGSFAQTGGTNFVNLNLVLGQNAGSTGTYTLTGSSSSLSVAGSIRVGFNGIGIFIQNGGNNTVTNNVSLAFSSGSGTYLLNGGILNAGANVNVGGQNSSPGGTGILTVANGATLIVGGNLNVYDTAGTVVNLAGGTIVANALNFNGAPSLLNWTIGELNVSSDVTWDSSASPSSTSDAFGTSLNLGNNQNLVITGNETLGGIGPFTLTLNSGSNHTVTGKLTISNTAGSFLNMNGGTLNANALTVASGALFRGSQASLASINATATISGTLSLDGESSFSAGNISIPSGGLLALNNAFASATTLSISSGGQLLMNNSAASELNANISNSGQITGAGQIFGTLTNNSGGVLNVNSTQTLLITGSGNTNPGTINLSGGTLDFTQTLNDSGTIQGFGALTASGNLTITSTGTLALAGSSSVSGNVTNKSGGTIHLSGSQPNVFFGAVSNNGTLSLDSGAGGTFYGAYTGSGHITNNGSLFLNATSVAGTVTGVGNLTINSGVVLSASAAITQSSILNSGTLLLASPSNSLVTANFTGNGGITQATTSNNTINGTYSATGPINISAGKLTFSISANPRQDTGIVLKTSSLSIAPTSTLDITNHDLILGNANLITTQNEILNGIGLGPGGAVLTSSTANTSGNLFLIPIDAAANGITSWDNVAITDPNSIIVKFTYFGDANLDGLVDGNDFSVIAGNFHNTTPGISNIEQSWLMGDVNLDGFVDGNDFSVIAGNFGSVLLTTPPPTPISPTNVPESKSLVIIGSALAWAAHRRKPRCPIPKRPHVP